MPLSPDAFLVELVNGPLDGLEIHVDSPSKSMYPALRIENELYAFIPDQGCPPHRWCHVLSALFADAVRVDREHVFSQLARDSYAVQNWPSVLKPPEGVSAHRFYLLKVMHWSNTQIPAPTLTWSNAQAMVPVTYWESEVSEDFKFRITRREVEDSMGFQGHRMSSTGSTPLAELRPTLELAKLDCWECWNSLQTK